MNPLQILGSAAAPAYPGTRAGHGAVTRHGCLQMLAGQPGDSPVLSLGQAESSAHPVDTCGPCWSWRGPCPAQ